MAGIHRLLTTPLAVTQGTSLTLVDILITVGVFLVFYALARIASSRLRKNVLPRMGMAGSQRRVLSSVLSFLILLAGVYASLSFIGIDLSIMLLPLGAVSIGLGLGLQTLASNYVAGIVLLTEKTIRDGDLIEVDGVTGTVVETGLRTTVVRTFNNTEVIVPNSVLTANRLENWTKTDTVVRVEAFVGVAYGSDLRQVHAILRQAIVQHPAALAEPEPCTFLTEFAASDIQFRLLYWVDDPAARLTSLSEILEAIYGAFEAQGIVIPFPQTDVWIKKEKEAISA